MLRRASPLIAELALSSAVPSASLRVLGSFATQPKPCKRADAIFNEMTRRAAINMSENPDLAQEI
jgi:hypothetical protein